MSYPIPVNEPARLEALYRYEVLDTEAEAGFDDLVRLASQICEAPMSLVSLVDRDRQWFKAKVGLDATETSREVSFCAHAIMEPEELFVVRDATIDPRFAGNPLVTGSLGIRFYAGAPLVTSDGQAIGTLCAIDRVPRELSTAQKEALRMLAQQVVSRLELHLKIRELQKRTEELAASESALRASRAYVQAVLDAATGFSIIAARPDGIITVFNTGAERMLGYSADEMIGKQSPAIIHVESEVAERGRQLGKELGCEVSGFDVFVERPRRDLPEDQEWTYVRKDGSTLTVRLVITALRDERGAITDFLGIARDITGRKQAEDALRASEERYRDLFESVHVIAQSVAPDGSFLFVNRGWHDTFGYSPEELPRLTMFDLIHPNSRAHCAALFAQVMAGESLDTVEAQFVAKDGRVVSMEGSVACRMENGRPVATRAVFHDVSKRRQAEDERAQLMRELESANTELKDFAHVVSHDLKAPLRAIGSLAGWIATDYADKVDAEGREQLSLLVGRTKRMHALIDGILQYSRAGRVREERSATNLQELVSDVIDLLAPPPHISVQIEGTLPVVSCERTRVAQVFQNLISNAIKYLDKPQGDIRIRGADSGSHWAFSVSDNGPGIDAKYFDRIFQLFQTLAPRDQIESTGVGLSVVKKIIDSAGGRVWVESALGIGSTFHFTLPK